MSPRGIPEITHLQFLVLGLLRGGTRTGHSVRKGLSRHAVRRSGPAFYQMMARLEDAGLVAGQYDQRIVAAQIIKERRYRLTARGDAAWAATRVLRRGHRRLRHGQTADGRCLTALS
jgi:DNA-binding PadR family transcriptional regulator